MSAVGRLLDPHLVQRLEHLRFNARRVLEGVAAGPHPSPFKGASVEFRQHRFYVSGDDPRRLDWRVLARTDRPYVREYDAQTNLRCMLLVDRSGSMAYGRRVSKFEYACRLAAGLAYLMLRSSESVGLSLFAAQPDFWLAPHGGDRQLSLIMERLERAVPADASALDAALHAAAERLRRRSLVIVISDCFMPVPPLREGLAHLRHGRHDVILLRVLDPDEIGFPFRHWVHLRGLEGEGARLIEPAAAAARYRENFRAHQRSLEEACGGMNAACAVFLTHQPPADALLAFLKGKRGRSQIF